MPLLHTEVQVRGLGRAARDWRTVTPSFVYPPPDSHFYTHLPRLAEREPELEVIEEKVELVVKGKRGEYLTVRTSCRTAAGCLPLPQQCVVLL